MKFKAREVLFSPTARCNLDCLPCSRKRFDETLSAKRAVRFLKACRASGVKRVSFTGGEPFLVPHFLEAVTSAAVRESMLFGRIMTNGAWFRSERTLRKALDSLFKAGYDGDLCVSVDAFHRQDLRKVARFISSALAVWKRSDTVSIAFIGGARMRLTERRLARLARLLKASFTGLIGVRRPVIRGEDLFIKIHRIDLAPIGRASLAKDPWDGAWFKDDYCAGPGNVFLVLSDGSVKPCCGYASDLDVLTIGNIAGDSIKDLLERVRSSPFISMVFEEGLGGIRRRLESFGYTFPGKSTNHCFFCHYLLTHVPRPILERSLERKRR